MEIFKLFGSILINNDEANKSLAKTDSNAKNVASSLGKGIATAGKFAAAIGTAAVGAAAGMYKMATSAAGTADNIDKMSQKIGISREAYQELDFVLSQSGTDVDKLQAGMKTMSAQVEKNAKAFEDLGVNVKDANGETRSQEEIFYDTVNALQQMQEGTEKSTLAVQLFGKAGTELMPLLNSEAGSLEAMRQEAHDLGLVLEDELIDNGVSLTDTLDKMKRSLSSVMTQLGARLMPIVEKAANFVIDNMPKINAVIDQIAPIIEQAFDEIMPVLMDLASSLLPQVLDIVTALLPPISNIFKALAPIITQLIEKLAPVIVKIVEKLLPPLVEILDALMPVLDIVMELLDPILDLLMELLDPIADILKMLTPIIKLALEIINAILKPIMPLISSVAQVLGDKLGGAVSEVAGLIGDGLLPIIEGLIAFLNGDFQTGVELAGQGLLGAFEGALGLIDELFGTNLKGWYQELEAFGASVGAMLEDAFNREKKIENQNTYDASDIRTDIIYASNSYMRQGMSAAAALEQAKTDVLTDADKQALFDKYLANELTAEEAENRRRQLDGIPHLATGGIVYGQTLAVVGDNTNVRNDPEVISPLSELSQITGNNEIISLLMDVKGLLQELVKGGNAVITMDGQKVGTVVANRLNTMRYNSGAEVVY